MRPRPPKNDTEKGARHDWMFGSPSRAMQILRAAGYDEPARARFLLRVVGLTERALDTLELHRDSYLSWLETAEKTGS